MLKAMKILSGLMSALYVVLILAYTGFSATFQPLKDVYLLDEKGALYRTMDLTKSDMSVGELKQEISRWLLSGLSFDYVSLAEQHKYDSRKVSKTITLPDTRDLWKEYFTDEGYRTFSSRFMKEPLFRNFWNDRKQVVSYMTTPLFIRDALRTDHVNHKTKRLEYKIEGHFYLSVKGEGQRDKRFKYDIEATVVRVHPEESGDKARVPYLPAMTDANRTGFKISDLSWKTTEKK